MWDVRKKMNARRRKRRTTNDERRTTNDERRTTMATMATMDRCCSVGWLCRLVVWLVVGPSGCLPGAWGQTLGAIGATVRALGAVGAPAVDCCCLKRLVQSKIVTFAVERNCTDPKARTLSVSHLVWSVDILRKKIKRCAKAAQLLHYKDITRLGSHAVRANIGNSSSCCGSSCYCQAINISFALATPRAPPAGGGVRERMHPCFRASNCPSRNVCWAEHYWSQQHLLCTERG